MTSDLADPSMLLYSAGVSGDPVLFRSGTPVDIRLMGIDRQADK